MMMSRTPRRHWKLVLAATMTSESESSNGVRKRNDRNRISGNIDTKELDIEPVSTENVDGTDAMPKTLASRAESFSSENAKRKGCLDDERAATLREAIRNALQGDELKRRKRKTRVPHLCISVLGMICLGWPSLLLFDFVLISLPFDHVEALQYSSQETSFAGLVSRLCLKIVKIARTAQITNKEYHGVITFACLVFLACLLYMVRVTTKFQNALTQAERQMLKKMVMELGKTPPYDAKRKMDRAASSE